MLAKQGRQHLEKLPRCVRWGTPESLISVAVVAGAICLGVAGPRLDSESVADVRLDVREAGIILHVLPGRENIRVDAERHVGGCLAEVELGPLVRAILGEIRADDESRAARARV